MRVLLLGAGGARLVEAIRASDDEPVPVEDRLAPDDPLLAGAQILVSYGYRHIIRPEVLARFGARAVNLHVSMLPWNRGADPNLWSFLEDTPKGVSIHVLDEGLDTGPLLYQATVEMSDDDTLRTSYDRLCAAIEAAFMDVWPALRAGTISPRVQQGAGSAHRLRDKDRFTHLLEQGWDTPVAGLIGAARGSGGATRRGEST